VYEKDFPLLEGYVKRISGGGDITYYYEGDWALQMEDAKEEIAQFVRKRKEKIGAG
jgi:hypothetical protein